MSLPNNSNITNQFWFCMVKQNDVVMMTHHVAHKTYKIKFLH